MKPLSQTHEKLPPGWLTQCPWGPQGILPSGQSPACNPQPSITAESGRGQPGPRLRRPGPHAHRRRPAAPTHLRRPRRGTAPGAPSSSCRPRRLGRHSSSRRPGCSSGPRAGRGSARRSQCPPVVGASVRPSPPGGPGRRASQENPGDRALSAWTPGPLGRSLKGVPPETVWAGQPGGNTWGPPPLPPPRRATAGFLCLRRRHPALTPPAGRKAAPDPFPQHHGRPEPGPWVLPGCTTAQQGPLPRAQDACWPGARPASRCGPTALPAKAGAVRGRRV